MGCCQCPQYPQVKIKLLHPNTNQLKDGLYASPVCGCLYFINEKNWIDPVITRLRAKNERSFAFWRYCGRGNWSLVRYEIQWSLNNSNLYNSNVSLARTSFLFPYKPYSITRYCLKVKSNMHIFLWASVCPLARLVYAYYMLMNYNVYNSPRAKFCKISEIL